MISLVELHLGGWSQTAADTQKENTEAKDRESYE